MSYKKLNLRKNSSNASLFAEKSWNQLIIFNDLTTDQSKSLDKTSSNKSIIRSSPIVSSLKNRSNKASHSTLKGPKVSKQTDQYFSPIQSQYISQVYSPCRTSQSDPVFHSTPKGPKVGKQTDQYFSPIGSQYISQVYSPCKTSQLDPVSHSTPKGPKVGKQTDQYFSPIGSQYISQVYSPCKTSQLDPVSHSTPKGPKFSKQTDQYFSPIESQYISQVYSPYKAGKSKAIESRCFLKLTKKVEKLIRQHNLSKLNASENEPNNLIYDLLETIYDRREKISKWLSSDKKDDVQRSSLFLRLTKVRPARNGFVDCECEIDLDRMKDVIEFKYYRLKTLIPKHYANEFEISNQALLEYISPWDVYDNDNLKMSFIINPFWIHILEHGLDDFSEKEEEIEFLNPNLNDKNLV